ncbi:hypothetical protein TBR22_A04440 [Luteitalea sp. TBR-22]|nr:hypothetical protein TBR22_A04440 [Luteitalea sp. TBR-22]
MPGADASAGAGQRAANMANVPIPTCSRLTCRIESSVMDVAEETRRERERSGYYAIRKGAGTARRTRVTSERRGDRREGRDGRVSGKPFDSRLPIPDSRFPAQKIRYTRPAPIVTALAFSVMRRPEAPDLKVISGWHQA